MSDNEVVTIPKVRRTFYDTYANLPVTNIAQEDLGYATDLKTLFRWSGTAWQPISIYIAGNQSFINLLYNSSFEIGDPPTGWTLEGAGASVSRSAVQKKIGTYSAALTRVGTDCRIYRAIADPASYVGRMLTLGAWVWCDTPNTAHISIRDSNANGAQSSFHTGDSTWQWLTVSHTNTAAGWCRAEMRVYNNNATSYFDGAIMVEGFTVPSYSPAPVGTESISTFGSYTGDSSVNRALAHGLGRLPSMILITDGNQTRHRVIGNNVYEGDANVNDVEAVTALDITNFYVGNAADYSKSGNLNARTYLWVAI